MRNAARAIVIKDDALLVMKRNKFGSSYYILVGGGVELGETTEQALHREVAEETGLQVGDPRLVFTEDAGDIYGRQHVFICAYINGTPKLDADSQEAKISALGQNTYEPMWLPLNDLAAVPFRSDRLRQAILDGIAHGFPTEPVDITNLYQV